MNSYLIKRIAKAFVNDNTNIPLIFRDNAIVDTPVQISLLTTINIYGYNIYNPNTVDCFVRLYTDPAGVATIFTTIHVPAQASVVLKGTDILFNVNTICWVAATSTYPDSSSVPPAAGLIVEITYK